MTDPTETAPIQLPSSSLKDKSHRRQSSDSTFVVIAQGQISPETELRFNFRRHCFFVASKRMWIWSRPVTRSVRFLRCRLHLRGIGGRGGGRLSAAETVVARLRASSKRGIMEEEMDMGGEENWCGRIGEG
ncbi:hypothetical protein LINPERHAP1_LOCUS23274 [Linum perenne]